MANASSSLSRGIASAIDKLEKKLIPKATQLPGGPKDHAFLVERLSNLRRLHTQSLETPMFSVVFLGDTQNGKSTLINALIGKKVLPEGQTGACSSAIVRCRYREKGPITATFTYTRRSVREGS
jgi:ribosome biogenesis GTPase A